ncbi:MAG: peptidoglycan DD-metalloendopeptidase family protein [Anaerolineales bacterium]|nr:peptidoglycan DD-metalloendopeptidase family protein [Anaerolineales bacterium]
MSTRLSTSRPSPRRSTLPLVVGIFLLVAIAVLAGLLLSGGMRRVAAWYLLQLALPVLGLVCLLVAGLAALIRRRWDRRTTGAVLLSVLAILPVFMLFVSVPYPASLERTGPAATVRLPADVPLLVAWGGDRLATNYHVIVPDQRWAYDFVVAPFFSGSNQLEEYGCYGVPVVAPIDGLVTAAHDGEPDATPGVLTNNSEAPTGNYVVIQMETGTYLLIAHLKQGSVLVDAGQRVREGQPIGQCGNSGNTSEPHIHIHHQRQDPSMYPINFAEGLPLFFRDHDGPPMPEGGFEIVDDLPVPLGPTVQHNGP